MSLRPLLLCVVPILGSCRSAPSVATDVVQPGGPESDAVSPARLRAILDGGEPQNVSELRAMQQHTQALIARVLPATVSFGHASGVLIEGGFVLTAGHVTDTNGKTVAMTLHDGRQIVGESLGVNHRTDTGLVRVTTAGEFPAVEMGDSGALEPGEWCVMLGHPGGPKDGREAPARLGRVLRMRRGFVTTDCPMQGGDSGGPLFDMDGRVVGINSRIAENLASNMHVPIDAFRSEWEDLLAGKVVQPERRGPRQRLGVRWDQQAEGARVREVLDGSPGARAKLEVGDVILMVGTTPVADRWECARAIRELQGDRVTLEVWRDGQVMQIELVFGDSED